MATLEVGKDVIPRQLHPGCHRSDTKSFKAPSAAGAGAAAAAATKIVTTSEATAPRPTVDRRPTTNHGATDDRSVRFFFRSSDSPSAVHGQTARFAEAAAVAAAGQVAVELQPTTDLTSPLRDNGGRQEEEEGGRDGG